MTEKVRVIDVLTEDEKREIEQCESKIIHARTPIGVQLHKRRAESIMEAARQRYTVKQQNKKSLSHY